MRLEHAGRLRTACKECSATCGAAFHLAEKCRFGASGVKTREADRTSSSCLKARPTNLSSFSAGCLAMALALAGCGGAGGQASKMTSFSTTESPDSKAELFSLPADQMPHIPLYTVPHAPMVRTLPPADAAPSHTLP